MTGIEKIFFADDDPDWLDTMVERLEGSGYTIVGKAADVEGVRLFFENLQTENTPTLAILDANMPMPGDGAKASEIVRRLSPTTVIVGFSGNDSITHGDYNLNVRAGGRGLVELIKSINEKQ